MKAARLEDGVLHIRDVDVPGPGQGGGAGPHHRRPVCATPISTSRAATGPALPANGTIGHEAIGIVEALGPGARNEFAQVGDRVILGLGGTGGGYWCGACEYCLQGQPRFCKENKPIIGTFAEYFRVWARVARQAPRQHRATTKRRSRAVASPRTAR